MNKLIYVTFQKNDANTVLPCGLLAGCLPCEISLLGSYRQ